MQCNAQSRVTLASGALWLIAQSGLVCVSCAAAAAVVSLSDERRYLPSFTAFFLYVWTENIREVEQGGGRCSIIMYTSMWVWVVVLESTSLLLLDLPVREREFERSLSLPYSQL